MALRIDTVSLFTPPLPSGTSSVYSPLAAWSG
jgi:hypothetical protein